MIAEATGRTRDETPEWVFGARWALAWGAAAAVLYGCTMAPGTMFGEDGPMLQTAAYQGQLSVAAFAHAFYGLVAYVFARLPFGETVAWRVNLLSVVSAASAIALLSASVPRWLRLAGARGRLVPWASGAAVAILAANHTLWWHATSAEVYALSVAFVGGALLLAVRFEETGSIGIAAGFIALLAISATQHLQVTFLAVWWLPWVVWRVHRRCGLTAGRAAALVLAGVIASAPYVALFCYDWFVHFRSLPLTVYFALGGPFLAWMAPPVGAWPWVARNTAIIWLWDITPWGLALGGWGIVRAWRDTDRSALGWLAPAALTTAAQGASYPVLDQQVFYLPAATVFTPLLAYGLWAWWHRRPPRRVAVWALAFGGIPFVVNLALPRPASRDDWDKWQLRRPRTTHPIMSPNMHGQTWPDDWARAALDAVEPDSYILAYAMADIRGGAILRYHQVVEGRRRDVQVDMLAGRVDSGIDFADLFDLELARRPVYLSTHSPAYGLLQHLDRFQFTSSGPLVQVEWAEGAPAPEWGPTLPCSGIWSGRGVGVGHGIRLFVRNRGNRVFCIIGFDLREYGGMSTVSVWRLHLPVLDAVWDRDSQTLSGLIPSVFGDPVTFEARVSGDSMTGQWSLGEPVRLQGSWTATRVPTTAIAG